MPATRPKRPRQRRGLSDVAAWAQTLDADMLLCRDLGHTWGPFRAWQDSKAREYVQVLRCTRCLAERVRHLDYRGGRLQQHYNYPDGYLAPAGAGVLSSDGRADLRLQSLLRLIDETNGQAPANLDEHRQRRAG